MSYDLTTDQEFLEAIMKAENSKYSPLTRKSLQLPDNGYVGDDKWVAYESPEDKNKDPNDPKRAKTIGYGHKLNKGYTTAKFIRNGKEVIVDLLTEEITDEEAKILLGLDLIRHEDIARREWQGFMPMGNNVNWEDLPQVYRNMMTQLAFNIGTLKATKSFKYKGKTVKVGEWGWPKLRDAMENPKMNINTILSQGNVTNNSTRNKLLANLWRPRLEKYKASLAPDSGNFSKNTKFATIDKIRSILPGFDVMNRGDQVNAIEYMLDRDKEIAASDKLRTSSRKEYVSLLKVQVDEQAREILETNRREEAEVELQAEVAEATKVEQIERTTDKVIDVELADVQYFQKPDGSVIKVNAKGDILE